MSEFKFSCPHCQQNIQATSEYAGVQINCPSCQGAIVVPQPAEAAAAAPKASKLSKAPSTVQHTATTPVAATAIVRQAKKKPRTLLYVRLGAGAVAIAAAIYFGPDLLDKYHQHKETVLAEQAATNAPPPPPPEPSADEILKKVATTYKELPSYSTQGESVGALDMSAINPALKDPIHPTSKLSLLLGRGGHFRIEWEAQVGPKTFKGVTWSAGKGDFVRVAAGTAAIRAKNWQSALTMADKAAGNLGFSLAELFFGGTNSPAVVLKNCSKTNNETLDGRKCYVLTGQVAAQNILFWIHKDDFLIAQAELVLSGKMDESALAGLNATQKMQAQMMSKVKGNIVETYSDIETNRVLNDQDFQTALAPNPNAKRKAPGDPRLPGGPSRGPKPQ